MNIDQTMRFAGNRTFSPSEAAPGKVISGGIAFHIALLARLSAAAFLCVSAILGAQTFPTKPITIINPNAPGGSTDFVLRLVAEKVSASIGQQVMLDFRPGAGGTVGTVAAKQAAPDGHTLLLGNVGTHGVNQQLIAKLPYDPLKDFRPLTVIMSFPSILVVPAESPAKSLPELIALAKSKPGGLTFASQGQGSLGQLLGEMLKSNTGAPLLHIPFKGGPPAVQETVAGRTDMVFASYITSGPHIRSGKLRALAVTSERRLKVLPDVPTMAQAGVPGIELDYWFGLFAPAGTPDAVMQKLHAEFVKAAQFPEVTQPVAAQGVEVITNTREEFAALIARDAARLGKALRDAGVKAN